MNRNTLQGQYLSKDGTKGGIYPRVVPRAVSIQGWYQGQYLSKDGTKGNIYPRMVPRAVSIQGWYQGQWYQGQYLFKGGIYSRVVSIQGQYLFKGGIYSRTVYIPPLHVDVAWLASGYFKSLTNVSCLYTD